MNCEECRELMLEADAEVLTGIGDEPVAVHITSCEACRDLARAMMGQLAVARGAYSRIEPESQPPRHASRFTVRRAVWAVATLAAAAAVVLALVGRRDAKSLHDPAPDVHSDSASTSVAVVVPDGRNAIVFATKNPLISVVWIY